MNIYQPYFYIIFFPDINMRYAGIRFAKNCHPNELMTKYKTSSKRVHQLINQNEKFIIESIYKFTNVDKLRNFEVEFLKDKITDERWINQAAGLAIVLDDKQREAIRQKNIGRILTDEHKKKISAGGKGLVRSDETRQRISNARKGTKNIKCSQSLMGHSVSKETRDKISQTKKSKPRTQAEIDAHSRLTENNRGSKRTKEFCKNQSKKTAEIWKKRTKEKLKNIDLDSLFLDLSYGMHKKDICLKYNINRRFLNKHILYI